LERFRYSDFGISPKTKCALCGASAREIRKEFGDYAVEDGEWSEKLDGWVCAPCAESCRIHPNGTVVIYYPKEYKVEKWVVTDYVDELFVAEVEGEEDLEDLAFDFEDDYYTCPIQFKWHRTDPWRGYYEATSEEWVKVHEDCILHWSRDAEELKKFHTDTVKLLWRLGVDFAVVYSTTSNLFSTGYDIFVKKEDLEKKGILIQLALGILKIKHRDPVRFTLTALTGKSGGFDEKDFLLLEAWNRLQAGDDPTKVQEDIIKKATEVISD